MRVTHSDTQVADRVVHRIVIAAPGRPVINVAVSINLSYVSQRLINRLTDNGWIFPTPSPAWTRPGRGTVSRKLKLRDASPLPRHQQKGELSPAFVP